MIALSFLGLFFMSARIGMYRSIQYNTHASSRRTSVTLRVPGLCSNGHYNVGPMSTPLGLRVQDNYIQYRRCMRGMDDDMR